MENSGLKKFIENVKQNERKRSIRKLLNRKRLKGNSIFADEKWTHEEEQKYGKNFLTDLLQLESLIENNSKIERIVEHLESLKTFLVEIILKMNDDQRELMLIDIFKEHSSAISKMFFDLFNLRNEACLSFGTWIVGLICISDENIVLCTFKDREFIDCLLACSSSFKRLKIDTVENVLYALYHILYDDEEVIEHFAEH